MFGEKSRRSSAEALEELRGYLGKLKLPKNALKDARQQHGLSQYDLAAQAGVSQPLISAIESGAKPLSNDVARGMAAPLDLSPEELQFAVRLGNLRRSLDGGDGGPVTLLILELMSLVEEFLPPGDLRASLQELLAQSVTEAVQRDKGRARELADKEAAAAKVATKSKRRKNTPDRDVHGRRIHKPTDARKAAGEARVAVKGAQKKGITRDSFGVNRSKGRG